ncbi:MAG: ABC-type transport auxiliary lipoprotein family protein [Minwuia sp.]|nr:ABC-type transport auxiliary lipoprotein family protein [Minwuia sp.]
MKRMIRRFLRLAIVAVPLTLSLAACGNFLGVPRAASNIYTLTPKSTFAAGMPRVDWQLVIEEPLASGGLEGARIAVRPNDLEMKYFADTRWTERAPKMIQTLLVESFENSGTIIAVGRQAIGLRADFSLKTELREFQVESYRNGQVRVRVNAKLIRQARQTITNSASFEATAQPTGPGIALAVRAFDAALGAVLRDIVEWTIREGQAAHLAARQ